MLRTVLITGVSSGIGLGLAREYLVQGVQVLGLSRREPQEFKARSNFRFQNADLRKSHETSEAICRLLNGLDRVDLVILNAGILGRVADMGEIAVEEFREVMEVNLLANKVLLDVVFAQDIPVLQVVAMSSGAATTANRGWNAYSISKAALNMMIALYA